MSNKFRPEIALSVYFNEQLLGVLPLALPQEPQLVPLDELSRVSNTKWSPEASSQDGDPIPLAMHLVGAPAAHEALRLMAMKKLVVSINLRAESGAGLSQSYAFDGQEIMCVGTSRTAPKTTSPASTYSYDGDGNLMDRLDTTITYHYCSQPPEPPEYPSTDSPTVIE